jgi:acyl-coenzyme A thioesterase PaaI-like protein
MNRDIADLVDRIRRHYDDGCFACGRNNPIGLHLDDFDLVDREVSARFTPRADYRGAGEVLHGGVAATALDEMLVWAGILTEKVMTVTGKLELRYRKPLQVTDQLTVRARVDELRGKRMSASGELVVDDDVKTQASGLFLVSADLAEMGVL